MKTYTCLLISHIIGIVLITIGGMAFYQHSFLFCTIACILIVMGMVYHLYKIQMQQVYLMKNFASCMKYHDAGYIITSPFKDRVMQQLVKELSEVLKQQQAYLLDKEVKLQYYEQLLNKVDTAVLVITQNDSIEWMNHAAQKLFGNVSVLPEKILMLLKQNSPIIRIEQPAPLDLATSITKIQLQKHFCWLVSLKNIHNALEQTEIDAWQKLIRVLTHEIMNSIAPIISLSETLNERCRGNLNDERMQAYIQQGIQVIHRRSKGLLDFVENYRKLTRISQPIKEDVMVCAFFDDLRRLFPDEKFHFSCINSSLHWKCDRAQMEQVFINLLKNADEACKNTLHPSISVHAFVKGDRLVFTVSDNGEGILPEVIERIFIPFFTTKSNGSGIGLSICKQIMNLHNGQLTVQSIIGEGSQFTLSFHFPE